MASTENALKLGKGSTFVKSQLRYLRQEDDTWEADFRALPKPITQMETHYIGMVIVPPDGFILAMFEIEQSTTVNDLAKLLADAMRRPLVNRDHRPRIIHLRGKKKWEPLLPSLKQLDIEVDEKEKLPAIEKEFKQFLSHLKKARSASKVKPTTEQQKWAKSFPAVAKWVKGFGHIEIGDQQGFGFIVRAIDYGGVVFEDDRPDTLIEAMATLEKELAKWFKDEKIDIE